MNATLLTRAVLPGALLGCMLIGGTAHAAPATQVDQQNFHGSQTFEDPNPCTGAPVSGTEVVNLHLHEVDLPAGQVHFHFSEEGRATATDSVTGVTYAGHFSVTGGENMNARSDATTLVQTNRIVGSDGSVLTVHEVMHVTTDASGAVTVSFDRPRIDGCS